MRFNKTIEFEEISRKNVGCRSNLNQHINNNDNNTKTNTEAAHLKQPLGVHRPNTLFGSDDQVGLFTPITNDFTLIMDDSVKCTDDEEQEYFKDDPKWSKKDREKFKSVRYVICTLALIGLAFALMSRLILNVSIVVMVEKQPVDNILLATTTTTPLPMIDNQTHPDSISIEDEATKTTPVSHSNSDTNEIWNSLPPKKKLMIGGGGDELLSDEINVESLETSAGDEDDRYYEDGIHFNWTKRQQSMVIGSFYVGYMPGILLSGGVAQKYGAKYPLFVCILGTAIINMLTPTIARYNITLLIASRIMLGLIQGSLFPALYELFNRWLTATESSIFAPLIKVSMPLGSVMGSLLPGLLSSFGLEWPYLFYSGGGICLVWSLVWLYVATSRPEANRFIEEQELKQIMRKKIRLSVVDAPHYCDTKQQPQDKPHIKPPPSRSSSSTPWLKIMTNPSVLALTLVKYTYNIGMDFIYLFLAVYLREAHGASVETISLVASSGYCTQMVCISFVGWLAKTVIAKQVFGLSVTKWRKIFQGGSNFCMALVYLILALVDTSLEISSLLILIICFFWMLGAGGESMIPYDLSTKYPASIVGLAHSISILSGVSMPTALSLVVGEDTHNPECWRSLFLLISGVLAIGGLVFVLVIKAKPFLPEEKLRPKTDNTRANGSAKHTN